MRSTFMGLEASKRGLFTQQSALYTTGHNISNANTDGYTRQRVNMETTPGYPGSGLNAPTTAGHIGTGVQAHSVQRMRDEFVDRQYRQETNKLGYWEATTKTIAQMEDVMSEPSEFGINQAFTEFWKSMEDVNTNPKDTAARQVLISKGQSLAESFNYMDTQLKLIQGNIGNEIEVTTKNANSILKQIAELNKQIQAVEPNGYMPNDLYDARDVLLDQLNEIMPVSVSYEKSGGNALAIAEGSMTVKFKPVGATEDITLVYGKEYATLSTQSGELVNGTLTHKVLDGDVDDTNTGGYAPFSKIVVNDSIKFDQVLNPDYDEAYDPASPNYNPDPANPKPNVPKFITEVRKVDKDITYSEIEPSKGKLAGLIDAYGYGKYDVNGNFVNDSNGIYPEMLNKLDKLVEEFVTAFNDIHRLGSKTTDINGNQVYAGAFDLNGKAGGEFFTGLTGRDIKVKDGIKPEEIAVSNMPGEEGNNKNMLALAALQSAVQGDLQGGTFQSYYKSLIGDLAVKGQQATVLQKNSETLHLQIENNRASFNSVSLDEEMTNMITFQQAYNANARMITVVDETLDKIINGMGRVGL